MITTEFKQKVVQAILSDRNNYPSANKQAVTLGISAAQLSRIGKGDLEQVLGDAKWLSIGRRLDVKMGKQLLWQAAKTDTFVFVYEQLTHCQTNAVSGMLCDKADIGKTFTAKTYCKEHKHAVYIDCSQVKSRQKLIRKIAQEFGVHHTGKYADVYADLVYYLQSIATPLVVLDEAGDLDYPAFLELKALWNATEGSCAWYMMGADGLKAKIESNRGRMKVGYEEIFSRFGSNYQRVSPDGKDAAEMFRKTQLALVCKVNIPQGNIQQIYAATLGSLRKTFDYAKKLSA